MAGKKTIAAVWGAGILLLAITGCASKEDKALFEKIHCRNPELKTLQQSEKAVFGKSETDKTIVLATYLPQESLSNSKETFVIAAYPSEGIRLGRFTLEKKAPIRVTRIHRKDLSPVLAHTIPTWFALYRLQFPLSAEKRMRLHIVSEDGASRDLFFYKGPKYLITKPKF
ncbi:hypothetical protein [Nitratifractor sp.]|uniref:hypothetical protein n=1 Tax=Nitratifractor sp. TaxID=2268144 RepID=UPI0025DA6320|nr:hypothetical protein [Nitratifractor sp.]